ncbi:MAG: ChaN family lipoprotein [bacterium]|nr:ChaN family lipoprotein [bacterium]
MARFARALKLLPFLVFVHGLTGLHAGEIPHYDLTVMVSPQEQMLEGKARLTLPPQVTGPIQTADLLIKRAAFNNRNYGSVETLLDELGRNPGPSTVQIDYTVAFPMAVNREARILGDSSGENVVDPSTVMLLSGWYPDLGVPATYRLKVNLPAHFSVASEAEVVAVSVEDQVKTVTLESSRPAPQITLVAGPYEVYEETFRDIPLRTMLFSRDPGLASTYMEQMRRFLELYETMLGTYPHKSFSVVESRFQTGYSYPTYTLLGSRVMRLPFIVETSLGHEILRQWFGNYVYDRPDEGRWSEGLATYLADHWYAALEGDGAQYRKKLLLDYRNYVSPSNDRPLQESSGHEDAASRAVSYGKGAMLFHMVRRQIGDDAFFSGLRRFLGERRYTVASWENLSETFSAVSPRMDRRFFESWLTQKGVPSFTITEPFVTYRDGGYLLSFDIVPKEQGFPCALPLQVVSGDTVASFSVLVEGEPAHFAHAFPYPPEEVIIDGDYDVMRDLSPPEIPPVISAFTGNRENLVIVPKEEEHLYGDAAAFFQDLGYGLVVDHEATTQELAGRSFLILSRQNRVYRRLFAGKALPPGGLVVQVEKNPLSTEHVAVIMDGQNPEEIDGAYRKIFRYGNDSRLVFEGGFNRARLTVEGEKGIVKPLALSVGAVETRKLSGLDGILPKIIDRDVVFVGEAHTAYGHHVVQLDVIRRLYEERGSVVIGMEMFQRPFQQELDRYVSGEISEEDLLRKSEYFTRWKYDYNLYRDILQFARANRIPVVALNLRQEIIKKVSREGINGLTEEEYALIPQDMDLTNQEYRESMQRIMKQHGNSHEGGMNFENFFQSQILWDETMAQSVVEALKKYPGAPVVVLAGNGHLQYSWGIPDRVKRLSGAKTAVMLNDISEGISADLADYLLYPPPRETPPAPKLMVILKAGNDGLAIQKVLPDGPARKAGIEQDDILVTINSQPIKDIVDVKLALLNKGPGDTIQVRIKRKTFVVKWKELTLDLVL